MFARRLRKNLARLAPLFAREETDAFRVYDRDIPERPWSVDLYGDRALLTEWVTPVAARRAAAAQAAERAEVAQAVAEVLGVSAERLFWRERRRHRSLERVAEGRVENEFEVREHGVRFRVNLSDYLDTGLFLDHRLTRTRIARRSAGGSLLNLFCYTGAFSVRAAAEGARRSVSVDLSRTYLSWAERNFALNGLADEAHQLVRADVFEWLRSGGERFDTIVIDPPTLSRSKEGRSFDLQKAQGALFEACLQRLAPGGLLLFSTNDRRFVLDPAALSGRRVIERTRETTPRDFRESGRRVWEIE